MKWQLIALASAVSLSLAACDNNRVLNGGDVQAYAKQKGTLSVLITDDLSTQFKEVWVKVLSVSAKDQNGQLVTLFQNQAGQVFNLSALTGIGQLLSVQSIPVGIYSDIEVTLDQNLSVVDLNGMTAAMQFATGGTTIEVDVPGQVAIDANNSVSIAIDFNLKQFSIDAQGFVVPSIELMSDVAKLKQTIIDSDAVVTEVNTNAIVVLPNNSNNPLKVELDDNTIVVNPNNQNGGTTGIIVGQPVGVRGDIDAAAGVVNAKRIDVKSADDDQDSPSSLNSSLVEAEGVVVAIDVNGITLDIKSGDFIPSVNSLLVLTNNNPLVVRGSLQQLAVGQKVEVKGLLQGNIIDAKIIEIESSNSTGRDDEDDGANVLEVRGTIQSVVDNGLMLDVNGTSINGVAQTQISVTLTPTSLASTNDPTILVAGQQVEVKGTFDGNVFVAVAIEVGNHSDVVPTNSVSNQFGNTGMSSTSMR